TKPCGIQNSVLELNQSNFLGADHRLAPNIMCENSENTVIFSTAWGKNGRNSITYYSCNDYYRKIYFSEYC
ncbi:hypothetical protein, partial [Glaesserella parasuis]|uniref:hypothetical protein n=7 Tax=Glaesserella parasuis TaxID=738 RepID=UPI001BE4987B